MNLARGMCHCEVPLTACSNDNLCNWITDRYKTPICVRPSDWLAVTWGLATT
jgi:hypothetical protein